MESASEITMLMDGTLDLYLETRCHIHRMRERQGQKKDYRVLPCKTEQQQIIHIYWFELALSQIVLNKNDLGY